MLVHHRSSCAPPVLRIAVDGTFTLTHLPCCAPQEQVAAEQRNKAISKVHSILKPFLLRRLKSDVEISLPRKMEMLLYAPMTEEQRRINTQLAEKTLLVGGTAALLALQHMVFVC